MALIPPAASWTWRPLQTADLPRIRRIAREAFPHHREDPERFAERLRRGAPFCFGLEDRGALQGYLLACPMTEGLPEALNAPLGPAAGDERWLFIHDLALRPNARGRGCGSAVINALDRLALEHALEGTALVAVNASDRFWSARGFVAVAPPAAAQAALRSYGPGAVYMRRPDPSRRPLRAET